MTADVTLWRVPPSDLKLCHDDVHVWCLSLTQPRSTVRKLERILSSDEQLRSRRFIFKRDRIRFIVARGALRTILSVYVTVDARQLSFEYGAWGKPALVHQASPGSIKFNVSHSYGLALCAVAQGRDVGVDLECVRELRRAEPIVRRYFSTKERILLDAHPESEKLAAFFRHWTRKEAYVKATGRGIEVLERIDIPLSSGMPVGPVEIRNHLDQTRWSIHELVPGRGYVATLVVAGACRRVSYWRWPIHESAC